MFLQLIRLFHKATASLPPHTMCYADVCCCCCCCCRCCCYCCCCGRRRCRRRRRRRCCSFSSSVFPFVLSSLPFFCLTVSSFSLLLIFESFLPVLHAIFPFCFGESQQPAPTLGTPGQANRLVSSCAWRMLPKSWTLGEWSRCTPLNLAAHRQGYRVNPLMGKGWVSMCS